jgi:hypothetical protein
MHYVVGAIVLGLIVHYVGRTGLLAVIVVLVVTIFYFGYKRLDNQGREYVRTSVLQSEAIIKTTKQHIVTLSAKRNQGVSVDAYGNSIDKKWREEVVYFVNNVLKELPGDILCFDGDAIFHMIDKEVVAYQNKNPPKVDYDAAMSPYDYERFCAKTLVADGWAVEVTPGSGDQGVDVIARAQATTVALQCKQYSGPVGNKAVQEVYAGRGYIGAHHAAVVTNASYTNSAQELARKLKVHLLHHSELSRLKGMLGIAEEPDKANVTADANKPFSISDFDVEKEMALIREQVSQKEVY